MRYFLVGQPRNGIKPRVLLSLWIASDHKLKANALTWMSLMMEMDGEMPIIKW
jgi:hypothetical protein